ncbi:MAG: twin-arginine translocation signal domain-containing protein [Actinobacteria bacterium]|nr:twin-arginine translocation signal domain-containing protein [Actinomycetota bacterium]
MLTRRDFVKWCAATGAWVYVGGLAGCARRPFDPGSPRGEGALTPLRPESIPKYATPLLVPPAMPRAEGPDGIDCYEISMRQFEQQILPDTLPKTTVWGYGPVAAAAANAPMIHNAPSLTIEARHGVPTRVKWINDLCDENGAHLPHLLPVDPTLHWANPQGKEAGRDTRPIFTETPGAYTGPVPIVTHVHGAVGVGDESDGYAEAWYLCDGPVVGYARNGSWYDFFAAKAKAELGVEWGDGFAIFQYPNENRASTLWYHDHALGMTRLNVYAGPAGFFILRGGDDGDVSVKDSRTGAAAVLPGPAPAEGDSAGIRYYEVPIAIQDRAFNEDGSLFYPGDRAFFDEIAGPFIPEPGGFSPIWNPEFFGNTIMVNGATWPYLEVERRRYRFRFLNGCQSRFLVLDFGAIDGARVWQIGNEGGFLSGPVSISSATGAGRLVMGLAERADMIVDFTDVPEGEYVLKNVGPDEPYRGGEPGADFEPANSETTGQVMQFRVVAATGADDSTPPEFLALPPITALPAETVTRKLALVEVMGMGRDAEGEEVEGPAEAVLGIVNEDGEAEPREWGSEVTENPEVGAVELWEIYNTTGDAHPMHVHETVFELVNRQPLAMQEEELITPLDPVGDPVGPLPHETGFKDTVIAYPGQVTRIRARFGRAGQFVWHCHIVEHEDNEMMRPFRIGPKQPGQPEPKAMPDAENAMEQDA